MFSSSHKFITTCLLFFSFFETRSHSVFKASLKFRIILLLSLPGARITVVSCHAGCELLDSCVFAELDPAFLSHPCIWKPPHSQFNLNKLLLNCCPAIACRALLVVVLSCNNYFLESQSSSSLLFVFLDCVLAWFFIKY